MAEQGTRKLIRSTEEFLSVDELKKRPRPPPATMRGIYVLYHHRRRRGRDCYNVVYVGMGNIRYRLGRHLKQKAKQFTHCSIFEVFEDVNSAELKELEGLFRHVYRFDSGPTLAVARSYN